MCKWGAYVRRTARQSMRRSSKPAPPGHPPHVHEGSIKRLLNFYYDTKTKTVVVGPEIRPRPTGAPNVMEFGGRKGLKYPHRTFTIGGTGPVKAYPRPSGTVKLFWTVLKTDSDVQKAEYLYKKYRLNANVSYYIAARPYMRPAMMKNLHVAPSCFKATLKGN